jgi:hypothetical protein
MPLRVPSEYRQRLAWRPVLVNRLAEFGLIESACLADVIRARRARLIEESRETFEDWPQASFAGARSIGEIIVRSRQLYREATRPGSALGA